VTLLSQLSFPTKSLEIMQAFVLEVSEVNDYFAKFQPFTNFTLIFKVLLLTWPREMKVPKSRD